MSTTNKKETVYTFEDFYETAKENHQPALAEYTPLEEESLTEKITAFLRPAYDKAIEKLFKSAKRFGTELDADALSRGMGASTYVSDLKSRRQGETEENAAALEGDYGAALAEYLYKAMLSEQDRLLEVSKFNAEQTGEANEKAYEEAQSLYEAYLSARGGGGGGGNKTAQTEQLSLDKNAIAVNAAAAKGQSPTATSYRNCETYLAGLSQEERRRVYGSGAEKYVALRNEIVQSVGGADYRKLKKLYPAEK